MKTDKIFTAFENGSLLVSGSLEAILPPLKELFDKNSSSMALVFDEESGRQVDFDLSGSLEEVLSRAIPAQQPVGPGRPKLGVVAREVTLLPRHWEWLEMQAGGASAALRRLVDDARATPAARRQIAIAATTRILTVLAGNLTNFEEATRALSRGDFELFTALIAEWPEAIRSYALRRLAA